MSLASAASSVPGVAERAVVGRERAFERFPEFAERLGSAAAQREVEPDALIGGVRGRRDVIQLRVPDVLAGHGVAERERER